mmetsp:Transcript_63875/g.138867  ORF Transcript_63875/g.138867 Transcript_63875/m.138867 type:complete len:375 (+) Transcript_63875:65-1189(+)
MEISEHSIGPGCAAGGCFLDYGVGRTASLSRMNDEHSEQSSKHPPRRREALLQDLSDTVAERQGFEARIQQLHNELRLCEASRQSLLRKEEKLRKEVSNLSSNAPVLSTNSVLTKLRPDVDGVFYDGPKDKDLPIDALESRVAPTVSSGTVFFAMEEDDDDDEYEGEEEEEGDCDDNIEDSGFDISAEVYDEGNGEVSARRFSGSTRSHGHVGEDGVMGEGDCLPVAPSPSMGRKKRSSTAAAGSPTEGERDDDMETMLDNLGVARCGQCGLRLPLDVSAIEDHCRVCFSPGEDDHSTTSSPLPPARPSKSKSGRKSSKTHEKCDDQDDSSGSPRSKDSKSHRKSFRWWSKGSSPSKNSSRKDSVPGMLDTSPI